MRGTRMRIVVPVVVRKRRRWRKNFRSCMGGGDH